MNRVEPSYFPDLTFGDKTELDDFMQQWFGRHLRSMKEPYLESQPACDTIRLLTLPTFHEPTLVRVERRDSRTVITTKRTDGRGGYGPGRITLNHVSECDATLFAEAQNILKQIDYWNLPALDDACVRDGTRYVIESNIGGKYHTIERAAPKKDESRLIKWLYSRSTGTKNGG